MKKIRISAVSYLNTIPFIYGIENSPELLSQIDLSKDYPAECARKLLNDEVDIGLIPIAVIPQLEDPHIITDFCIGAVGKVDSVILYSDVPLNEIQTILLDYQSRTSVRLCRLLCEKFWKIEPNFASAKEGFENSIEGKTAGVVIGDRTFNMPKKNQYCFDLAEEWHKWTSLPFVFAAWVSNKKLSSEFLIEFDEALKMGIKHTALAVSADQNASLSTRQKLQYLTNSISYSLDSAKKKGLNLFLKRIGTK